MVKIRTTVPVMGEREKWLDKHYPRWDVDCQHEENGMLVRTQWYIELPDKLATMYLLRWS